MPIECRNFGSKTDNSVGLLFLNIFFPSRVPKITCTTPHEVFYLFFGGT